MGKALRVLVVDDSKELVTATMELVRLMGHQCWSSPPWTGSTTTWWSPPIPRCCRRSSTGSRPPP